MTKNKKLALVPANTAASEMFLTKLPDKKKLKRLSSPQLIRCEQVPIGGTVSGVLTGLVQNLSKEKKMGKAVVLTFHHKESDRHFMFPMTGVIRAAIQPYLDVESDADQTTTLKDGPDGLLGKTLFITRREDGKAKKFGGNRMFNFDVDIAE